MVQCFTVTVLGENMLYLAASVVGPAGEDNIFVFVLVKKFLCPELKGRDGLQHIHAFDMSHIILHLFTDIDKQKIDFALFPCFQKGFELCRIDMVFLKKFLHDTLQSAGGMPPDVKIGAYCTLSC